MRIKERLNTSAGTAVICSFVCGIVAHLFGLVNVLHNYDDIAVQPSGFGGGISLGRWFLEILGGFFDKCGLAYNLPFVNGVIFIGLIALSAGCFVSIFHVQKRMFAALIGMLFAVFPTVTATLFFRYTAPFYGVGILLAVLAAWILRKSKCGLILSAILTALSMGIYQAYVPITIGIFVLLLIQQALEGKTDSRELIRRGLYDCMALLLGVIIYFFCLKVCMLIFSEPLTDYRGVSNMGQIRLHDLPSLIWQAFYSFCALPFRDYCELANRALLKIAYILLAVITVVMIGIILFVKVRNIKTAVMTCVLCLLFPIAVNFIVIMCPDNWIYTLMVYSFVLVACVPLILYEQLPSTEGILSIGKHIIAKSVGIIVAVLIFGYAYYANVNYTALYYANCQVENYLNSIVVQVRMTEGFTTEKEWAFLGDIKDPLLSCNWEEAADYGGSGFTEYFLNQYSRNAWIQNHVGYSVPMASDEKIAELSNMREVEEMPCWPDQGSIKVIGDTVVIKFQNIQ